MNQKEVKEKAARLAHLQKAIAELEKEAKPLAEELKALAIAEGEPFGNNGRRLICNLGYTEIQIPVVLQTRTTVLPGAVHYAKLTCPEVIVEAVDPKLACASEHAAHLVKQTPSWSLRACVVNDYAGKPNN
jgi:hypothetical protein